MGGGEYLSSKSYTVHFFPGAIDYRVDLPFHKTRMTASIEAELINKDRQTNTGKYKIITHRILHIII